MQSQGALVSTSPSTPEIAMCFGSPKAPKVVYQGPSDADIAAQQASLDAFAQQTQESNQLFLDNMQAQIDKSNQEMAALESRLAAETAAANAAAAAQQTEAYATTASMTDIPENAQTTEAIKKKDKPKSTLKITKNALPTAGGTGLNLPFRGVGAV